MPFLEPSYIEERANNILQQTIKEGFYDGNSHTPLDKICEFHLGLEFVYLDLETTQNGDDISGFINFENKQIVLNNLECKNSYHKGRINFTIAHEIGHWVLHKSLYENKVMLHTEFSYHTPKLEWQANHFSACLLMPRSLVIKKWNELKPLSPQERRSIMADFFRVSLETMNIRISKLKLI